MDLDVLLIVGVGAGAFWLMRRNDAAQPGINNAILDPRDAWAQYGAAPEVDQSILDARDAMARAGIAADGLILDARDAWALYGGGPVYQAGANYPAIEDIQYDQMGNVINVAYWGDNMRWEESKIPRQYLQPIRDAEARYGLPRNLLARQLWQESRYNAAAVNAYSGAQGIAQFMPATAAEFGIDPFNALQAIDAAGRYMAQLYQSTGTWLLALAAYNWGIGNVLRKGIARAPTETKNYYSQILADIGMTGKSV
jgi:soluble lytic murein transglycosylase-like protein